MCVYIYIYTHVCVYVYMYIYVYIYIYAYIYIVYPRFRSRRRSRCGGTYGMLSYTWHPRIHSKYTATYNYAVDVVVHAADLHAAKESPQREMPERIRGLPFYLKGNHHCKIEYTTVEPQNMISYSD